MQRSNAFALASQSRLLDAVEAALRAQSQTRPVRTDEVLTQLEGSCDSNRKREMSRLLTLVARLAPDALGRRLVFAGRVGAGYAWTVARG